MKAKIKSFLVIVSWIFATTGTVMGQDPFLTQYFSTPMYYNPAFTGIGTGLRARFNFRDQAPRLPVDFKALYFSADLGDRSLPGSGGLGIMVNSDNEGLGFMKNLGVALTIGVRIPISSYLVSQVGIKAGILQKTVNWDDFVFTDQLSEKYGNVYNSDFTPPDANKKIVPDFAAGGVLQYSNEKGNLIGNIGFAVDHIFEPDQSFLSTGESRLPRKWIVHTDAVFSVGEQTSSSSFSRGADEPLKINPGIIFISQGKLNSIEAGLNLMKFNIYLGGWYKSTLTGTTSNALAVLAGYRFYFAENMSIKFIYSYDIPISGAMVGTGGAHEISLVLEFEKLQIFGSGGYSAGGRSRRGYEPLDCPVLY
jgi:type IX secretion system PorP/SprF family membrane protein